MEAMDEELVDAEYVAKQRDRCEEVSAKSTKRSIDGTGDGCPSNREGSAPEMPISGNLTPDTSNTLRVTDYSGSPSLQIPPERNKRPSIGSLTIKELPEPLLPPTDDVDESETKTHSSPFLPPAKSSDSSSVGDKISTKSKANNLLSPILPSVSPGITKSGDQPPGPPESSKEFSKNTKQIESDRNSQIPEAIENTTATFRKTRKGCYKPVSGSKLRNNLLASVGFLEFGNATDFAANVWNTIPIPIYAASLMGLGGGVGIIVSFFALKDGMLSWQNITTLRRERKLLLEHDAESKVEEGTKPSPPVNGRVDAIRLEVNKREFNGEIIDRFSMDALMGFGALIVGTGTILAIGGANPRIYHASNLLSGYIGNAPSLGWGICNTIWCLYVTRRARIHLKFALQTLRSEVVKDSLKIRIGLIQWHAMLLGIATVVSGPAGMVTVSHWQGYVVLIPCIITAIYCNWLWRKKIGYERPLASLEAKQWKSEDLVQELEWTIAARIILVNSPHADLKNLVAVPTSADSVLEFIVRCDLFENFCCRLLRDRTFTSRIADNLGEGTTVITTHILLETLPELLDLILETAQACIRERGQLQLRIKERWLLEMLGASLSIRPEKKGDNSTEEGKKSNG